MSRGTSGTLKDLPAPAKTTSAAADNHDPHSYFNNDDDDDDEDEDNNLSAHLGGKDTDSKLAHLKRNIQQHDMSASEVISESASVASEDIDVLEFSNGGSDGNNSDSDGGF